MSTDKSFVSDSGLIIERQEQVWTFILNRPEKRNALSVDLVEGLIQGLDQAHAEQVPVLVFRGQGKNFSAGFDFSGFEEQSEGDLVLRFVRLETLLQKVAASPAFTIGLAHGRNFGAGVDLFAACKHRICEQASSFRMPGLRFGLVLGSRRFANIVGREKAVYILASTATFDTQQAISMTFVHEVAEPGDSNQRISALVTSMCALGHSTRSTLFRVLDNHNHDADMADLVRSASVPGLKARLQAYLKGD